MNRHLLFFLLIPLVFSLQGCNRTQTRIACTPLTLARDLVDAPLVSLTNVMEEWAKRSDPFNPPSPGVGWSSGGGFGIGIGYNIGFFIFKPLSWIFGGVDYVVCRSFFPNWPKGWSPWKRKDKTWGSLYFINTRALWGKTIPENTWEKKKSQGKAPEQPTTGQPPPSPAKEPE